MHMYLPNFLYFLSNSENGNELQTDKLKTWAFVYKQLQVYIGVSLSKPHTKAAITKSEYLWIIPVPKIRVRLEILCVFQYIDVLTCMIVKIIQLNSKDWGATCCLTINEAEGRWYTDAYDKRIETTELVQSCGGPATCHRACVKWPMLGLTVLFHINIGVTLNYSTCVLVVWCWAIRCSDITGTPGSYHRSVQIYATELLSQYNQLRVTPSISWIH